MIRPVLGPGSSLPLYKGSFEDGVTPDDDDVIFAASRNSQFWEYWDSRSGARKGEPAATEWKLRMQFINQKEGEEVLVSDKAYAFFRSGSAQPARSGGSGHKTLKHLTRSSNKAMSRMAASLGEISKAATSAIADTAKAASAAVAEATKQTAVVSEMAKLAMDEASELKVSLLALHAKTALPQQAPASTTDKLKELYEFSQTALSFADGWVGAKQTDPPPSAGA